MSGAERGCAWCGKPFVGQGGQVCCSRGCGQLHAAANRRVEAGATGHGHQPTVHRVGGVSRWSCRRDGCGWQHTGDVTMEALERAPCPAADTSEEEAAA